MNLEEYLGLNASPLDVAPLKFTQLRGPQAVPEGGQDHGGIPLAPAIARDGRDQLLNLALSLDAPAAGCPHWAVWTAKLIRVDLPQPVLRVRPSAENRIKLHKTQLTRGTEERIPYC